METSELLSRYPKLVDLQLTGRHNKKTIKEYLRINDAQFLQLYKELITAGVMVRRDQMLYEFKFEEVKKPLGVYYEYEKDFKEFIKRYPQIVGTIEAGFFRKINLIANGNITQAQASEVIAELIRLRAVDSKREGYRIKKHVKRLLPGYVETDKRFILKNMFEMMISDGFEDIKNIDVQYSIDKVVTFLLYEKSFTPEKVANYFGMALASQAQDIIEPLLQYSIIVCIKREGLGNNWVYRLNPEHEGE